jgi:glucosamine-6-phosphate deaminase
MSERRVGEMAVVVHHDAVALAEAAAAEAADTVRRAVEQRGVARAMFATGNSQLAFVDALVAGPTVPWDRVVVFHMDEYVGVGPDHPAGFQHWIRTRISDNVHPQAAHYLDGLAEPLSECERYAALVAQAPLDLCCLGIGVNGHLAFNDPSVADFDDPVDVKVVELDDTCRRQQVDEGHFPTLAQVPPTAMTVTIPALLRARRVLGVVPERRKAPAVGAAVHGPLTTACPASVLRTASRVRLHLDRDSAALLEG